MAAVLYPQIVDATIFWFLSMVDGVGLCLNKVGTAQGGPVIAVAVVFLCVISLGDHPNDHLND